MSLPWAHYSDSTAAVSSLTAALFDAIELKRPHLIQLLIIKGANAKGRHRASQPKTCTTVNPHPLSLVAPKIAL